MSYLSFLTNFFAELKLLHNFFVLRFQTLLLMQEDLTTLKLIPYLYRGKLSLQTPNRIGTP